MRGETPPSPLGEVAPPDPIERADRDLDQSPRRRSRRRAGARRRAARRRALCAEAESGPAPRRTLAMSRIATRAGAVSVQPALAWTVAARRRRRLEAASPDLVAPPTEGWPTRPPERHAGDRVRRRCRRPDNRHPVSGTAWWASRPGCSARRCRDADRRRRGRGRGGRDQRDHGGIREDLVVHAPAGRRPGGVDESSTGRLVACASANVSVVQVRQRMAPGMVMQTPV